jgi:hypothetical protein
MQYWSTQPCCKLFWPYKAGNLSDESNESKAEGFESPRFSNRVLFRSRSCRTAAALQDFGSPIEPARPNMREYASHLAHAVRLRARYVFLKGNKAYYLQEGRQGTIVKRVQKPQSYDVLCYIKEKRRSGPSNLPRSLYNAYSRTNSW